MNLLLIELTTHIGETSTIKQVLHAEGDFPTPTYPIPKHDLQDSLFRYYQKGLLTDMAYFLLWQDAELANVWIPELKSLERAQKERMKARKALKNQQEMTEREQLTCEN